MDPKNLQILEVGLLLFKQGGFFSGVGVALLFGLGFRVWRIRLTGKAARQFRLDLPGKMRVETQINAALDGLLAQLDCDRAAVYQYHNGSQNVCGIHFAKCSNTHERVQVGGRPHIRDLQNLPNSLFASLNLAILENKELFTPDIAALKEKDISMFHTLNAQGVKSFYVVGIFSFDLVPIGFVGVDFSRHVRALSEKEQDTLRATALKICGLIISERNGGKREKRIG